MVLFSACSSVQSIYDSLFADKGPESKTAEQFVTEGLDKFNQGDYDKALKLFEELRSQFPFGEYSLLAELKEADCNFYLDKYQEALFLYEEFEANHPTNEAVPYVVFQIGRCYYLQVDTIDRDPKGAVAAIRTFNRLISSYPDSPYTTEAQMQVQNARDFLASHEMYVAVFYLRTGSLKQSENRLETLIRDYPDSVVSPQAKELLAAIKAGNPPQRTWREWLPDIAVPNIKEFATMRPGPSAHGSAP